MNPRISVLINSYLRITFLSEAFESVVRQLDAEPFEIVLINALENPPFSTQFERLAKERGIDFRMVRVAPGPVGSGLSRGISEARGEVIALLDDDDLWEPRKVRVLQRAFSADPGLGLFHNGQAFVDDKNRVIGPWNPHRLVRHPSSRVPEGRVVRMIPGDVKGARMLLRLEAMFNNSSLSFRKSILESQQAILPRLTGGEDCFIFNCALASGMSILATSDRLTRVRVHRLATTAAKGGEQTKYTARVSNYKTFLARHLQEIELSKNLFPEAVPPLVSGILQREGAQWQLLHRIIHGRESPTRVGREIRVLLGSDGLAPGLRDLLISVLGLGSEGSAELARAALIAWRMAW